MLTRLLYGRKFQPVKTLLAIVFFSLIIFPLYFWHIGNLTKGLSPAEVSARMASSSLQSIIDNPVYAPHKIVQYATQKAASPTAANLRIVSSVFAIGILFCFYVLVKGWFGRQIGFLATLILGATPWVVLLSRNASADILLLAPAVILACYYWLTKSKSSLSLIGLVAASALSLYVPGMVWLVVIGAVAAKSNIAKAASHLSKGRKSLATVLGLILLAPLIYGSAKSPSLLKPLFFLPDAWPQVTETIKSIAWSTLSLIWRTPAHIDILIGRLPILDYVQIILAFFGGFALYRLARNKLYILMGLIIVSVIGAGINKNPVLLTLALPATAVLVAAGLRYLYMEWRSVFPKNPIPKYLALVLLLGVVGLHIFYGLRYSLSAWPNTKETRVTYVLK
ncbi:glycosyltransferase family 39 protein [Candidatus Saccharibacteria bacterium]|nr:glycosyltransferase family 39 protein [Candidatus Saccharibacteria bacterium]